MILRRLLAAAALVGAVLAADDDGETRVHGQVGAENATTPMVQDGNRTIHFVTVGKATNNFYVRMNDRANVECR
jgi:hypothetical protein